MEFTQTVNVEATNDVEIGRKVRAIKRIAAEPIDEPAARLLVGSFVALVLGLSPGCLSPETRAGIAAGTARFSRAVDDAANAAADGSWIAGGVTLLLGTVAAVAKGFHAAGQRGEKKRQDEIQKVIKKAKNGKV